MRNCNCGSNGAGSTTRVIAGDGIVISGSGTPSDPLVISSEFTSFAGAFLVQDTPTVDMTLFGAGTQIDPFILSATSAVGMSDLTDVNDPAGPAAGEVPIFNGTDWEFANPPTQAPGLVNATGGITGDGTVATPLKVRVSNLVETSTAGAATYIDSAGELRAVAGASDWNSISNKPTSFPTTWDDVSGKPSAYPDALKISGHKLFVQSATPTGMVVDDIWIKKP